MNMKEKCDERYENQLRELALNRFKTGNYKMCDDRARVITRKKMGINIFEIPIREAHLTTPLQGVVNS